MDGKFVPLFFIKDLTLKTILLSPAPSQDYNTLFVILKQCRMLSRASFYKI